MSTLLLLDSFDHQGTAQQQRKWTTASGSISAGRTGNGWLTGSLSKTFGPDFTKLTAGLAYKSPSTINAIMTFSGDYASAWISHNGDGRLRVSANLAFGGIIGSTASGTTAPAVFVLNANTWYYIEFSCELVCTLSDPYTGAGDYAFNYTVRVNEGVILTGTLNLHIDFRAALAKFSAFTTLGAGGGAFSLIDDLYITDTEFLGDIKIGCLYPRANGDSIMWVPFSGLSNPAMVKEHPADDDASYNSAAAIDDLDLYLLDPPPAGFTGVIKGAQALWLQKKSDAGSGSIKGQWKSGGVIVQGAEFFPSDLSYLYDIQAARKSLFTAGDWTIAELTALQLGIKRTL